MLIVQNELVALTEAGCTEITVDEAIIDCLCASERPGPVVTFFNRTVAPIVGKCRFQTHLCFGNYKGRAIGPAIVSPDVSQFLDFTVDEMHVEMASREVCGAGDHQRISARYDVASDHRREEFTTLRRRTVWRARAPLPEFAPADRLCFGRIAAEPNRALGGAA